MSHHPVWAGWQARGGRSYFPATYFGLEGGVAGNFDAIYLPATYLGLEGGVVGNVYAIEDARSLCSRGCHFA